MATSGTYNFGPSLGELVLYAYNVAGLRNTSLTQEHMESARLAANMVCVNFSNRGVNLWKVDLQVVPLVQGQSVYTVPQNTVVMLDAYLTIDNGNGNPTDRIILPVSRTEYASYPNKEQQGFTTVFWFDRLVSPNVYLWPVPDGTNAQYLKYYRLVQMQDAGFSGAQNVDIPYRWYEAFTDQLAYRLAAIWSPQIAPALKAVADQSYIIAASQDTETCSLYISPQVMGYYRP